MTILQYLQSKTEPGTKIPMQNLTNLMQNAGYPFDWRAIEGLKKQYKALDELNREFAKELKVRVYRRSKDGVIVATDLQGNVILENK